MSSPIVVRALEAALIEAREACRSALESVGMLPSADDPHTQVLHTIEVLSKAAADVDSVVYELNCVRGALQRDSARFHDGPMARLRTALRAASGPVKLRDLAVAAYGDKTTTTGGRAAQGTSVLLGTLRDRGEVVRVGHGVWMSSSLLRGPAFTAVPDNGESAPAGRCAP